MSIGNVQAEAQLHCIQTDTTTCEMYETNDCICCKVPGDVQVCKYCVFSRQSRYSEGKKVI
jgi:hypothetical protein